MSLGLLSRLKDIFFVDYLDVLLNVGLAVGFFAPNHDPQCIEIEPWGSFLLPLFLGYPGFLFV